MPKRYRIDLFAGAGGLSCGLEQSGFVPVLANELVEQYAHTYQVNHPETKMIVESGRASCRERVSSPV